MSDNKPELAANNFYNWFPEVEMAVSDKARMYCVLDYQRSLMKYKVTYIKNNKKKEISFNDLESAIRFFNEKIK